MCKYPTLKKVRKSGNHSVGQLIANILYHPAFTDIQSWHIFLQFLNPELKLCDA